MTIDSDFLQKLCCPRTRKPLRLAGEEEVSRLNEAILARDAQTIAGKVVTESVSGGLIPQDEPILYPVRDDIPILLIDEAIRWRDGGPEVRPSSDASSASTESGAASDRPDAAGG